MNLHNDNMNIKTALLAVLFILATSLGAYAKPTGKHQHTKPATTTMAKFDFAFPKTVAQEATVVLKRSIASNDAPEALHSLLALTVAKDIISNENAFAQLELIDSVAKVIDKPYNAVALLMEAQLYYEIYTGNPSANSRIVDQESPDNPEFWDRNKFKAKIFSLVEAALNEKRDAVKVNLSAIAPIVTVQPASDGTPLSPSDFTLFDFIAHKSVDLISRFREPSVIPFYNNTSNNTLSPIAIAEEDIESHDTPTYGLASAILMKANLLDEVDSKDFLWKEIDKLKEHKYVIPLIGKYFNSYITKSSSADEKKEFYRFVKSQIDIQEKSKVSEPLHTILKSMELVSVQITVADTPIPGKAVKTKLEIKNINNFNLLVYRVPDGKNGEVKIKDIRRDYQLVQTIPVSTEGDIPFFNVDSLMIAFDRPGQYVLICSKTKDLAGLIGEHDVYPMQINVSAIDIINWQDKKKNVGGCFVVDSDTSAPIAGAKVVYKDNSWENRNKNITETVFTDASGYAQTPFKNSEVTATYNGSTAKTTVWLSSVPDNNLANTMESEEMDELTLASKLRASIIPDRAVYRPGDTIEFCAVLYINELLENTSVKVRLINANYQEVDSLLLTSDKSGRVFGKFQIPKDGLLGRWQIQVGANTRKYISVEEYKTPSILLSIEQKDTDPGFVLFEGVARTYSGMPLQDLDVEYSIRYSPFFLRMRGNQGLSYSNKVETDSEGKFIIKLPTSNLPKEYYTGVFTLTARATDNAGETAEAPAMIFFLSRTYRISPSINSLICLEEDSLNLKVQVYDQAEMPVMKRVRCLLVDEEGKTVEEREFDSPSLTLDVAQIPSGKYTFKFRIEDEEDTQWTETGTIFYRKSDKTPPYSTPLWVPETNIYTVQGQKTVEVPYGCSIDGHSLLCVISDSNGMVRSRWLESDGENHRLLVDTPSDTSRLYVNLITFENHEFHSETVTIIPDCQRINMELSIVTFRNLISPGDKESWQFIFEKNSHPIVGYGIAVLYDKALDNIAPTTWALPTKLYRNYPRYTETSGNSGYGNTFVYRYYLGRQFYPVNSIDLKFNTWGQMLYQPIYFKMRALNAMDTSSMIEPSGFGKQATKGAHAEKLIVADFDEEAMDSAVEEGAGITTSGGMVDTGEINYRPAEMPVAFFMPDLSTDSEGKFTIDFTVPDFNTTWNFILGAYTPELQQKQIRLETVASKKVMAKLVYPRFVRTGDKIMLTATLFNNTERQLPIEGKIEVFDPVSNEVLSVKEYKAENVKPSHNRVISIEFDCPASLNAVGIRAYGMAEGNSDGEQTVIPVLPSSQPVIESTTFYAAPGQRSLEVKLPEYPSDARITLSYCDNPLWEVLTALTPIVDPDSETIFPNVCALYANSVGYGILSHNSSLHQGLELIIKGEAGDSLLISNLEKNQDLKTVTLNNTPWVNDAQSETLRMSKLSSLLDEESAIATIRQNWSKIMKLHNPDGGWSWFKETDSSPWVTEGVLINLGLLRQSGYLLDLPNVDEAIAGGIRFCENDIMRQYAKYKNKSDFPYSSLLYYLYMESFFPEVKSVEGFGTLKKKALDEIEKNWKSGYIFDKATMAILLWREGRKNTAREIVESLKQFTSYSPEKGMWYDNLASYRGGSSKMLATARVLEALHLVNPEDSSIDLMRQWMLLQRQTQDWQEGLFSIDAINTLLTTGSSWDGRYGLPSISIGDMIVASSRLEELTGAITVDIPLSNANGKSLEISRTAPTPAWGGVISQFVAPAVDIKAANIPDLSIEKKYWKLVTDDKGAIRALETSDIHVGDKLRIALIVECGKDMDFVALTDERGACVEPVDKTSGYTCIDGIWCYREIRNSSTNLFFPFLPKGRHVFYYECNVQEEGEFAAGIATLQCLYAPVMTAHSAGDLLKVKSK